MACPLATERVWTDKVQYHAAEKQYHEYLSKLHNTGIKNDTNQENDNTNQVNEAYEPPFKSPVKKISKNQRKRQQRGSVADDEANLDAVVSDSSTTRDVKLDAKKNNKKQRHVPQPIDAAPKPKEKFNGGKNKQRNLPQQSSIEDESLTESIAHENKSPIKKTRNNNKGKVQIQSSTDDKFFIDLMEDGAPQKSQNKNQNQSKRAQQQRANNDSNDSADQKQGPNKKESKTKPNETDSMKRQKNKQNAKKNPIWFDEDKNLPSTIEEPNEHKSSGFESSLKMIESLSVSVNILNVSVSAQAHPDDAENKIDLEQFIEVPTKRKRSRRAKKDKQAPPFTAFVTNDGKTNSSRSESISSIDIQSMDIVIAEEAFDKTKDVKEFENIVHQKKSSENIALMETDNRIYDTVVNVVDNILKEQVKNRGAGPSSLASEIAKARQHIKNSLERMDGIAALASTPSAELLDRLSSVEKQNAQLQSTVNTLQDIVEQLQEKIRTLELGGGKPTVQTANTSSQVTKSPPAPVTVKPNEDDDDGVDLFGSDSEDEDEATAKVREQRLADYAAKKSKKVALIAKSNIILDIKPWSDETDMKEMEKEVRAIKMDGLLWGAAKLVPLAYGIHKLQISTVVEDDKVSIDALQEEITNIEELVQSVDIAAFNKI